MSLLNHRSCREVRIPVENLIAYTFLPAGFSRAFPSWLMPLHQVRLAVLMHPDIVRIGAPGHLVYAVIAPRIVRRTAITHWDKWGLKYLRLMNREELLQLRGCGWESSTNPFCVAKSLFGTMKSAFEKPWRIPGRVQMPRTLCAVDPHQVVEPEPTRLVLQKAYEESTSPAEAYARLYETLCISPQQNHTGKLLIDTGLINRTHSYPGFGGSTDLYLDLRPFLPASDEQIASISCTTMLPSCGAKVAVDAIDGNARCMIWFNAMKQVARRVAPLLLAGRAA